MAEREGWEVAGEYADEAVSAWRGDRGPELASALEHAAREAPAVLIVQHSDRLARGDGRQARHLAELYFWALSRTWKSTPFKTTARFPIRLLACSWGAQCGGFAAEVRLRSGGMKRRREAGEPTAGRGVTATATRRRQARRHRR